MTYRSDDHHSRDHDYKTDWDKCDRDDDDDVTSSCGDVDVTLKTPDGHGDAGFKWYNGVLWSSPGCNTSKAYVDFSEPVENVTFAIYDVDAGRGWDDRVTVIAKDAEGNVLPVTFSNLTSHHQVNGNTIEGGGNVNPGVDGSGAADSVTVTIPGPVSSIQVIHTDGDSSSSAGTIGLSEFAFDCIDDEDNEPQLPRDGLVEGTLAGDLIDAAYADDPEGDFIDNSDALLPGEAPQDDIVLAGDGDDTVLSGAGDDEVYAGSGSDTVRGGEGDDVIYGDSNGTQYDGGGATSAATDTGAGDDVLYGEAGNDTLYGEGGNDRLHGGTGDDTIYGGDGDDTVFGGEGNDTIYGEAGNDTLYGNGGDDYIDGGAGDDYIRGSADNDTLLGGDGDDDINGEGGEDTIDGGAGNDTIKGGSDADTIKGGSGNDTIDAMSGDDVVDGGAGDDIIKGGAGNDRITGGDGSDTVYGDDGDDYINTAAPNSANPLPDRGYPGLFPGDADPNNDRDYVEGGNGNDTIITGDDNDTIYGGAGNDRIDAGFDDDFVDGGKGDDYIVGGEGSDTIYGGEGNDTIYGGLDPAFPDSLNVPDDTDERPDNGRDVIHGGDGDDRIFGQDDDDEIYGDAGNDYIDGGIDDDTIYGGAGNDTIIGGEGEDTLFGGDDRDLFLGGNGGDHVDGGSGGDDFDTLDLTGSNVSSITYTSDDREDGIVNFADGSTMTFEEIENVIPCFTPGTLIATPMGERRVEDLREGDRVITRDNGIQEIRWTGQKLLDWDGLRQSPHLQPVLIRAGSLGNNLPERDMLVSPNHRMLIASDRASLYFEEREVLVAAKHLLNHDGVERARATQATYIHFMFDNHEVVLSDGTWTESFQPGDYSLKGMDQDQRAEIFDLFPDLRQAEGRTAYQAARKTLKRHEAVLLVS